MPVDRVGSHLVCAPSLKSESERRADERRPYEYGMVDRVGSHLVCAPRMRSESERHADERRQN
jgi:hypothetical protein